jgi:hypothetical protein
VMVHSARSKTVMEPNMYSRVLVQTVERLGILR